MNLPRNAINPAWQRFKFCLAGQSFPPGNVWHFCLAINEPSQRTRKLTPLNNQPESVASPPYDNGWLCNMLPRSHAAEEHWNWNFSRGVDRYPSRLGLPEEILSDLGVQFVSDWLKEVMRLLSIKQQATTPYHPMCNGIMEKLNWTMKSMLKRLCSDKPRQWHRYFKPPLFAYRKVPQESSDLLCSSYGMWELWEEPCLF